MRREGRAGSVTSTKRRGAHLDITRSSVQVEVKVLDLPVLGKFVCYVLLGGLFVDVGDEDDPSFNGCVA